MTDPKNKKRRASIIVVLISIVFFALLISELNGDKNKEITD